jgi:hypothetical protein
MIAKKLAPVKAGVADFSDKIMRNNRTINLLHYRLLPENPAPPLDATAISPAM